MAQTQAAESTATLSTSAPSKGKSLFNAKGIAELNASPRTGRGKGEARRIRSGGRVPAVAYGKELASTLLTVSPKEVLALLQSERGQNAVIEMHVDKGQKLLVMIRDYTYHPVHRGLEHVDFVQVKLDKPVNVEVPLFYTGKAAGVVTGGIVRQVYRMVPVSCLPDRIPLKIEVDITRLAMGEAIAASDLPVSEGVTVRLPPEQTVISIVAPEKDRSEDAAVAAPGAAGATPAAGAAPAAEAGKDAKGAPAAKAAAAPAKDAKKK